jgi:RHS repeat-associated protein
VRRSTSDLHDRTLHGGRSRRWARSGIVPVLVLSIAAGSLTVATPAVAAPAAAGSAAAPFLATLALPAPPVAQGPTPYNAPDANPEQGSVGAGTEVDLPDPEVAEVVVGDEPVAVGDTPVSVAIVGAEPAPGEDPVAVEVEVLGAEGLAATGASAMAFTIERTAPDAVEPAVPAVPADASPTTTTTTSTTSTTTSPASSSTTAADPSTTTTTPGSTTTVPAAEPGTDPGVDDAAELDAVELGVTIDYSAFRDAYGGDFASRLVVKAYPACVLERPTDPECSKGEVVPASNDLAARTLSLDLSAAPEDEGSDPSDGAGPAGESGVVPEDGSTSTTVPGATTSTTEPDGTSTTVPGTGGLRMGSGGRSEGSSLARRAVAQQQGTGGTIYTVSSGLSGANGTYAATSLAQSSRWQAGGSSGNAGWSYPIDVPVPSVGSAPEIGLSYSSQAVDGMTPGSNGQSGPLGLGWDVSGLGFIERRYRSCQSDGTGWIIGDLCWHSNNATISLNGTSSELVPTSTAGVWRLEDDPGWRVEHKSGGLNGDDNAEYWVVTTTDGTQYWFGYGAERGSGSPTGSAWTVPVYGNQAGEPCYSATQTAAWCNQAYRWNLDRIVDTNNNLTTVFWAPETNRYSRYGTPANSTSYTRGGTVSRIDYSMASGSQSQKASVIFAATDRCVGSLSGAACPSLTKANAAQWPDVPVDIVCTSTTYCDDYSPSFFSTKRFTAIYTSRTSWAGTKYVDSYSLTHTFPSPGDGTDPKLWFDAVQRTGNPNFFGYTGSPLSTPPVTFDGTLLANRADASTMAGVAPAKMRRLTTVHEEMGADITFAYGQPGHPCTDKDGPWDVNDQYCFPVWFKPDGQAGGWAVNNTYVVTRVDAIDGTGGSPTQTTTYAYLDAPAWHHDDDPVAPDSSQTWGDYRGHSKVQTTTGGSSSTALFFRGMHGDKRIGGGTKSVSITDALGGTATDSDHLAGRLREDRQLGPDGSALQAAIHGYHVDATTPTSSAGLTARFVLEDHVEGRTVASTGNIHSESTTTYDSAGFPVQVDEAGDTTTGSDDRCIQYTYARNTATWMLDRVGRTKLDFDCAAPYNRVTDTLYDDHTSVTAAPDAGNPTSTRRYSATTLDDTPTGPVTSTVGYDSFGRPTSWRTPMGSQTSTSYLPADSGATRYTTVTGPTGYTTTTEVEPRRGQLLDVTDLNGRVTTSTNDSLGRVTAVRLPQDTDPAYPSLKFGYSVSKTVASRVHSYRRRTGGLYVDSWSLVDGFGRARETQSDSPAGTGRIVTATEYDGAGQVASQSLPYYTANGGAGDGLYNAPSIPAETLTWYDALSRPTASVNRSYNVVKSTATTSYDGFTTQATSPEGRRRRTTGNSLGDTVEVEEQYESGNVFATTTYDHTVGGLLTRVTDTLGNVTTSIYDNLGRKVAASDPDAGSSTFGYDEDGHLTTVTDARGQSTFTDLDDMGRLKARYAGASTAGSLLGSITYWEATDSPSTNRGLPKEATSVTADGSFTSRTDAYDSMGRPTQQTQTVPAGAGSGLAGTYTSTQNYDAIGNPVATAYPAAGGLPAETVTQAYDGLGLPTTLTTSLATPSASLVSATGYQNDARLASRTLGTGAARVQRSYSYETATGRLATIIGTFPGATPAATTFQADRYRYDLDGNVTSIADNAPGASGQQQCFTYDMQNRLYQAWTSGSTDPCTTIGSADLTVGPSPYRQTWTHDVLHNITSTTRGTTSPVTSTYGYPADAATGTTTRPHAVTSVSTAGQADTYAYDANGALTTKTEDGATSTLAWDAQQRLSSTTTGTAVTSSRYAVDGSRLLRREPDGSGGTTTTLYLGNQELKRTEDGTVTAQRTYAAGGATVALRQSVSGAMGSTSSLTWMAADSQNSAQIAVDAGTTTVKRQRYLPYGEARGPEDQLPTDHDFLGKVKDDSTDTVLLDARVYDPNLGKFLSPDPLFFDGWPATLNAYAYSGNSPVTFRDPTGSCISGAMGGTCAMPAKPAVPVSESAVNASRKSAEKRTRQAVRRAQREFFKAEMIAEYTGGTRAEFMKYRRWERECPDMMASCYGAVALTLGLTIGEASVIRDFHCNAANTMGCSIGEVRHDEFFDFLLIDLPSGLIAGGFVKVLGGRLVAEAGIIGGEAATSSAASSEIRLTGKGLQHVFERHVASEAGSVVGKSVFAENVTITRLIADADGVAPVLQANGNLARTVNAGRTIGIDRLTGSATSTYTVITRATGELVTAFPGTP